ncbi:MAG: hypothetical protein ACREDO_09325 [Methyloceanibacter sp.]
MGKRVHLYWDKHHGGAVVTHYRDMLPRAFAPVLVLDAFGELQEVYRVWAEKRGDIEFLPA